MKTEKRLTMALSVLVALMMLAVPLASSSNLFVDGGQTNSNGDAPVLGADASYDITFKLNADNKSLDTPEYTLPTVGDPDSKGIAAWYKDENGDIHAIVEKNAKLGDVIAALYSAQGSIVKKIGYDLDVWKNEATGAVYNDKSTSDKTPVTSDMTFSAVWLLKDTHHEVSVIVDYKGETTEYVKAYEYDTGSNQKKITVSEAGLLTEGVPQIDVFGIVVNYKDGTNITQSIDKVYSFKATYGDNKEFEFVDGSATIPADSKITIKYTFDSENYSEITVKSDAFNKEIFKDGSVTLYASKLRSYSYADVYNALVANTIDNKAVGYKDSISLPILTRAKDADSTVVDNLTEDGYKLTGWNEGAELLQSENNASSPLTLDAKLNGYYVIFMVNGQFEYVYVPFGELSADKTTLDIAGVNHWVWMKYSDATDKAYKEGNFVAGKASGNTILPFNFASTSDKSAVESGANGKTPAAVLIACFTPSSSTSYAVFDASSYATVSINESTGVITKNNETSGTFGSDYVKYIIVPGKAGDSISTPAVAPSYGEESKVLFISWMNANAVAIGTTPTYELNNAPYSTKDKFGAANSIISYYASAVTYKNMITFYDGSEVVGVFYYDPTLGSSIDAGLVAFETGGKAYSADDLSADADPTSDAYKAANKAYTSILYPDKDGYTIKQWNNADKNAMITFDKSNKIDKINIKDMKDDLNLYAEFKADTYTIVYSNTFGDSQTQTVYVDENVKLYGEIYLNEGFKLLGWTTSAGSSQVEYKLEGSYTLSGADYEKLVEKNGSAIVNMYPVWEKVGSSGSGSGDNTDGNNDSNTDTYLLAGILVVIIILIIVVAVVLRKKQ